MSESSAGAIRVLHVAETIKGGTATYLNELLPHQIMQFGAENVLILVPESHKTELPDVHSTCIRGFAEGGGRAKKAFRVAALTEQLANEFKPDVIHVHLTFAGITVRARYALRRNKPKIVYCPHGWAFDREAPWMVNAAVRLFERLLAPFTDAIVAISDHERKAGIAVGIPAHKLHLIYNAICAEPPTPSISAPNWPEGAKRLVFVGRFDRQKGVDLLMNAMRELRGEAFAYVIGEAVLGDGVMLDVPDNVRLTGWLSRAEIEAYYKSADAIVIPSRWEGFGLISVEAMRAGLAVIASRVGGLQETVEHGVTGVLIEAGDAATIVETVRLLDRGTLQEMGRAGQARFLEKFTIDRLVQDVARLYQA